jgi:hypothetical protein
MKRLRLKRRVEKVKLTEDEEAKRRKEYQRDYYLAHRERAKEYQRAYNLKHRRTTVCKQTCSAPKQKFVKTTYNVHDLQNATGTRLLNQLTKVLSGERGLARV